MSQIRMAALVNASSMTLLRGDLNIVAGNLKKAQDALEASTGGRQTWLDPVVAIARSRANEPLPEAFTLDKLEAENASLKDSLFGKTGVASGLDIIEECLAAAVKADPADAPFPLDVYQAALWHRAQAEAYRHALEMISIDPVLLRRANATHPQITDIRFIRCDEASLGVLGGLGVHPGVYDHARGGVTATLTQQALAEIAKFPADFILSDAAPNAEAKTKSYPVSGGRIVTATRDQAVWERETFEITIPNDIPADDVLAYINERLDSGECVETTPPYVLDQVVDGMDTVIEVRDQKAANHIFGSPSPDM